MLPPASVENALFSAILTLALVDLLYGVFVSPFFVENYVKLYWNQSVGYCKFYEFYFTFHDFFVPLILILLSTYISLKYAGKMLIFIILEHACQIIF